MTSTIADLAPYLPFILLLPFLLLNIIVSQRWARQRKLHPPPSLHITPNAWLSYWLPRAIAIEVYSLLAAGAFGFWATISSAAGAFALLGVGAAMGICLIVYVCVDVGMLIRARGARKRLRAFP